MFIHDTRYISERYTRNDYLDLHLAPDSSDQDWTNAIEIFMDRIRGRYVEPMNTLVRADVNKNGFAAMALGCLLIETLLQFREGRPETASPNTRSYADFLYHYLGVFNTRKKATRFYQDIRCGILHSAQTKKGACLTFNQNYDVEFSADDVLMVNINSVCNAIERYIHDYREELLNDTTPGIRLHFVTKMNDITRSDEGSRGINDLWLAICNRAETDIVRADGRVFRFAVLPNGTTIRFTNGVNISKNEVGRALIYWPDENSIRMINSFKSGYIILLIRLCENAMR